LASGDGIALRRTASGPLSESCPCDRSSALRASAGSGNAAIGSRALIGRAWSCRNPFGRRASFDHQRKPCGSFLTPRATTGASFMRFAETTIRKEDSPDRQKARGGTVGLRDQNAAVRCAIGRPPTFQDDRQTRTDERRWENSRRSAREGPRALRRASGTNPRSPESSPQPIQAAFLLRASRQFRCVRLCRTGARLFTPCCLRPSCAIVG
jgi:hypothetical protein